MAGYFRFSKIILENLTKGKCSYRNIRIEINTQYHQKYFVNDNFINLLVFHLIS